MKIKRIQLKKKIYIYYYYYKPTIIGKGAYLLVRDSSDSKIL